MIALLLIACSPTPLDGQLPAGSWGGEHYRLDVASDGTATLEGDCSHGSTAEPLVASEGALTATFSLYDDMASVTQDTADDAAAWRVELDAQVAGSVLDGTLRWVDEGWTDTIQVTLGQDAVLFKCQ